MRAEPKIILNVACLPAICTCEERDKHTLCGVYRPSGKHERNSTDRLFCVLFLRPCSRLQLFSISHSIQSCHTRAKQEACTAYRALGVQDQELPCKYDFVVNAPLFFWRDFSGAALLPDNFVPINQLWSGFIFPELEHLQKNVFTASFPKRSLRNLGVFLRLNRFQEENTVLAVISLPIGQPTALDPHQDITG